MAKDKLEEEKLKARGIDKEVRTHREAFAAAMANPVEETKLLTEYCVLYPSGSKPGRKRKAPSQHTYSEVHRAETGTLDRIKTKLMDWRAHEIFFRTKKGWKPHEVVDGCHECKRDLLVQRNHHGKVAWNMIRQD